MIQAIRGKVGSWVVKILFFLLILSFAVWGLGDMVRDQSAPSRDVAEVGDQPIPLDQLQQAFQGELQRLNQAFGVDLDRRTAIELGLLDSALDELIDETALNRLAREMELRLPHEVLLQFVRQQEVFQTQDGSFSPSRFAQVLAQAGLSEEAYLRRLEQDLTRSQIQSAVGRGARAPDILAEAVFTFERERRDIELIGLADGRFDDIDDPDEGQIRAFYDENPELFQAPEYRDLSIALLSAEDVAEGISVSEDRLIDEFEARRHEFEGQERRAFLQVVVDDEETAEEVASAAHDAEGLEELAQDRDDLDVIPLDLQSRNEMPFDALAEAGFEADPTPGTVIGPVQTPFGWHVMELTDYEDAEEVAFEDVRDELLYDIRIDQALDRLFEDANRFEDAMAAGLSLSDAADEVGIPIIELPAISEDGSTRGGEDPPDLPGLSEILSTAFTLPEGEASSLRDGADNTFYVVQVDGILDPETRPLDEVRDAVVEAWRQQEQADRAEAAADEATQRLADGEDVADVADDLGGDHARYEGVLRNEPHDALPQSLVEAAFEMDVGETTTGRAGDQAIAMRLANIAEADPDAEADALDDIRTRIAGEITADVVMQFRGALRDRYGVTINQERIDETFRPDATGAPAEAPPPPTGDPGVGLPGAGASM